MKLGYAGSPVPVRTRAGLFHALAPTQMLVLSFVGLILIGTLGFLVLPGLYTGDRLGVVDALFTATSAVCVTGLIVVDTATYFTPLGQAWILALIQAGGLGILTFTTLALVALGRRAPLGVEEASGGRSDILVHLDSRQLVLSILAATALLEAIGFVALWAVWQNDFGVVGAVWPALFHAISAFCNAGFSTFTDSLTRFDRSPTTLAIVSLLVVMGGVGFVVLEDLKARLLRRRVRRLSLHTKLVLLSTGFLIVGGALLFLTFEWNDALGGLPFVDRIAGATFMSITPRTAGFNTVDYRQVTDPSVFLTILLMVVGGSPGSTAGGVKTVTVTLLVLVFWSRLRGERRVSVLGRTVPNETIQRATGLVTAGLAILAGSIFLLLVSETLWVGPGLPRDFVHLMFEAHSAFGTVGLSMGATPELTPFARLVVVGLMFMGRLGPPAIVAAMSRPLRGRRADVRYGEEDVMIG